MKVYIASSVWLDYTEFLSKCIRNAGVSIEPVFFYDEITYRKLSGGNLWSRLRLRIGTYLLYPLLLCWRLVWAERDSVFVITSNTFYAPLFGILARTFKAIMVVHLVYDLFPDAVEVVQGKPMTWGLRQIFQQVATTQITRGDVTVFLGEHLRQYAEGQYGKAQSSCVIDIGAEETLHAEREVALQPEQVLHFHYGGQVGYMHDVDTFVEGIRQCQDLPGVEFSFAVSGVYAKRVTDALAGVANCTVGPTVPSEQWRRQTRHYHIGMATLTRAGANVCIPSKAYSMMAAYMGILAICPQDSDLARLVNDNECGWLIEPGDVERFVNLVRQLSSDHQRVECCRLAARRAAMEHFGTRACSQRWATLLKGICKEKPSVCEGKTA